MERVNLKDCLGLSLRNRPMIIYDGFSYNIRSQSKETIYWRCVNRKCYGILKTSVGYDLLHYKSHNHEQPVNINNKDYINGLFKEGYLKSEEEVKKILSREIKKHADYIVSKNINLKNFYDTMVNLIKVNNSEKMNNKCKAKVLISGKKFSSKLNDPTEKIKQYFNSN